MAELFWLRADESIANALIASRMLLRLSADRALRGPHMVEERRKMKHNAQKFEQLAVGVLSQCHFADAAQTRLMLQSPIEVFDGQTPIHVAWLSDSLDFLSHPAAQDQINKVVCEGEGAAGAGREGEEGESLAKLGSRTLFLKTAGLVRLCEPHVQHAVHLVVPADAHLYVFPRLGQRGHGVEFCCIETGIDPY